MRKKFFQTIAKISLVSLVLSVLVFQVLPVRAGSLTNFKDTMSRLKKGEKADHEIKFTLPAGIDFDAAGNEDMINVGFNKDLIEGFVAGGTFATTDFSLTDGVTTYVIDSVIQGNFPQIPDCTGAAGTEKVRVGVEFDNEIVRFRACPGGGFTASGSNITINVYGTAGDGTLTNPSVSENDKIITVGVEDEGLPNEHLGELAVSIIDDDQVVVTANIDSTFSFDIDTTTVAFPGIETAAPYTVAFGSLNPAAVNTSNTTSVNIIYLDMATNATSGGTITVQDSNVGLTSTAAGHTIASTTGLLSAGTEGYGICVGAQSNFNVYSAYSTGNCTPTKHTVKALQTTPQDLIGSDRPFVSGRVEVFVKTAISNLSPAANDYTDTLTFIATGTF